MANKNEQAKIDVIVNGQRANASLKEMEAASRQLRAQWRGLRTDSPDYARISREMQQLDARIRETRNSASSMGTSLNGIIGGVGKLIPVLAGAWGTIKSGEAIIKSAQATADQWEIALSGAREGLNYLMKSVATMDFSNFFTNMREAVKAGREYAAVLDDLGDRNRALNVQESDAKRYILERTRILRDATKTEEERIKAADEVIAKEDELAAKRVKNATIAYDAEIKLKTQQSGLSKQELESYLRNYDQLGKNLEQGEAYNELLERRKELMFSQGGGVDLNKLKELAKINEEIKNASSETKKWGEIVKGVGKLTDEELDKLVELYKSVQEADVSALENTQKVAARRSTLLAELKKETKDFNENENKEQKKAQEIALKALEQNFKKQQNALSDSFLKKEIDSKTFNARLYTLEDTYLEARLVLFRQFGMDTTEVERQILGRRVTQQEEINEQIKAAEEAAAQVKKDAAESSGIDINEILRQSAEEYARIEAEQIEKDLADDLAYLAKKDAFYDDLAKKLHTYAGIEQEITGNLREMQLNNLEVSQQKESEALEAEYQRRLNAAGKNEEARARVEEEFGKKRQELVKKQAEEEKKVRKKYALIDFLMQAATIIADTASAVAKSIKLSPATFGLPWSAVNAAIGATQLGVAYSQYNKVKQLASGRYDVIGASDGQSYSVPFAGDMQTGMYSQPVLVAERGPEVVIDNPTLRNIQINEPDIIPRIMQNRVKQYATGNYDDAVMDTKSSQSTSFNNIIANNNRLMAEMAEVNRALLIELKSGVQMNMQHFENSKSDWDLRKDDITRK
jgi:DNA repair exonuclease SbcCD ATPase subunit